MIAHVVKIFQKVDGSINTASERDRLAHRFYTFDFYQQAKAIGVKLKYSAGFAACKIGYQQCFTVGCVNINAGIGVKGGGDQRKSGILVPICRSLYLCDASIVGIPDCIGWE